VPERWREEPAADEILRISRAAHAAGGIDPGRQRALDRVVGAMYGLSSEQMDALGRWDAWLAGVT
jgi:hypothetical protein